MYEVVRDHIPLEQGLRHGGQSLRRYLRVGQRPYSIRTRIKTERRGSHGIPARVRDHIPLEQGLRRRMRKLLRQLLSVRDHIPLEQGLRLTITLRRLYG